MRWLGAHQNFFLIQERFNYMLVRYAAAHPADSVLTFLPN